MNDDEGKRIEIWVEDDQDFGGGDGGFSKRGAAWDVDPDGNKGSNEVGDVQRTDRPTQHGTAAVTLVIRLNGRVFREGTVVAKGALPYDGDIGSGLLAITGGTGGHAEIAGVIQVESWNPKKYSVQ
jgi:hypothetical protein